MKIRPAEEKDLEQIMAIVAGNTISREEGGKSGLVEYPKHDRVWYLDKIGSKYFHVIDDDGTILGFLSAYDQKFLQKHDFKGDEIIDYLLKNKSGDWVYADLIAITKNKQGKGYGRMIMSSFLDDCEGKTVYGAVAHEPWKNQESLRLIKCFDFELVEEIKVYKGLKFGLYLWEK